MLNILVTGGAGYIGSILCRSLVEEKEYRVIVYDSFSFGVEPILPLVGTDNFEVIEGDIRSEQVRGVVSKADVIIHLAAVVGYPACDSNNCNAISTNVDGTKNIVKHLSSNQWLLYASTGSVYGQGKDFCSEDSSVNPLTLYATTKYEAEKIVMERENSIALRFATVFGVSPRMRMDLLVNDLLFQAIRNKAVVIYEKGARRTFLHCRDAAESYLFTLNKFNQMKNQIYNVGNPLLNLTKYELVTAMKRYVDFHILDENTKKDLDGRDYTVNFSKIQNQGYRSTYSLDDGIKELMKLYSLPSFYRYLRNA